ncbi:hypothetical protein SPRG_11180 [Saprolegnia parasitica CBS 223.65]|uniref:Fe2OG dioxygenase domain-containing protein n=1 Tax=Saprolegnia parasitica (strain CBS 223.65) TaxID=695850 RepID=A0A067C2A6_SAPPC|nr:hypothetical protein SPRG_11180 [Saprolegnia parasitica CBS 223.65]KDO23250.1 hypothetical protein SPRG_11180 [Saprolegnia parasitica CBS 223.65]|eukprot:XP_012206039.1 hypothetical protein SPRG_11180 [Saprolegnia parasitica CBS 223.65]
MRVPIVDCFGPQAAMQLRQACMDVGFFYLRGHGVPRQLQRDVYKQMAAFFALPIAEKRKAVADKNMRGWAPMYEETLDPAHQTKGDTKEAYHVCRESLPDEVHLPLHDTCNVFPDAAILPHFKTITTTYFDAMSHLGLHVARVMATAAGAPGAFDAPGMFDRPMTVLRMLHYNAEASNLANGVIACGAHSDFGLLTLLSTDTEPGLQIEGRDGHWVDVPYVQDAFIVNVGDLAERWTNGLFRSTRHRVVNSTGRERYSVPFFFEPNFHCNVTCLPSCVDAATPAKYPPISAGANLLNKYSEIHASYPSTAHEAMPASVQGGHHASWAST